MNNNEEHLEDKKKELLEAKALHYYVTEDVKFDPIPENQMSVVERVKSILQKQEPLQQEISVFRGQKPIDKFNGRTIIPRESEWFSASFSQKVALEEFTNTKKEKCCLFKINIHPGIKILAVNDYLSKFKFKETKKEHEDEVIIDGNGVFTDFIEKEDKNGNTYFETNYKPKPKPQPIQKKNDRTIKEKYKNKKNTIFYGIEAELINTNQDLFNQGIVETEEEAKQIWEMIQKELQNKPTTGGRKRYRKTRKNKKRKHRNTHRK